jgi:fructose/tagatose bisphosphate aldolase
MRHIHDVSLCPFPELLAEARGGGYAVGYFESWDITSLHAVLDAAEALESPVIVGFSGEFLTCPDRCAADRIAIYGAAGRAACESATVPCSFIFNECPILEPVYDAIHHGFNVVMHVDHTADVASLTVTVRDLVTAAHGAGIAVEAELDELPDHNPDLDMAMTDVATAAEFVADTGVDALSVSVGNVHIMTSGRTGLDVGRVEALAERVAAPLVLHGGSGIDESSLRDAIAAGVSKVNYGTTLKQAYLRALKTALEAGAREENPHRLLGIGREEDIEMAGRLAMRDEVKRLIELLGSAGKR